MLFPHLPSIPAWRPLDATLTVHWIWCCCWSMSTRWIIRVCLSMILFWINLLIGHQSSRSGWVRREKAFLQCALHILWCSATQGLMAGKVGCLWSIRKRSPLPGALFGNHQPIMSPRFQGLNRSVSACKWRGLPLIYSASPWVQGRSLVCSAVSISSLQPCPAIVKGAIPDGAVRVVWKPRRVRHRLCTDPRSSCYGFGSIFMFFQWLFISTIFNDD